MFACNKQHFTYFSFWEWVGKKPVVMRHRVGDTCRRSPGNLVPRKPHSWGSTCPVTLSSWAVHIPAVLCGGQPCSPPPHPHVRRWWFLAFRCEENENTWGWGAVELSSVARVGRAAWRESQDLEPLLNRIAFLSVMRVFQPCFSQCCNGCRKGSHLTSLRDTHGWSTR